MCIAIEELDESLLWLELTEDLELTKLDSIRPVKQEMKKILAILSSSKQTLRSKLKTSSL